MSEITDDYWEIIPSSEYVEYVYVFGTLWFLKKELPGPSCFLWPAGKSECPTLSLSLSFLIPGDNKIKLPDARPMLTATQIWIQNNGKVSFAIHHNDGQVIVEELPPEGTLHMYLRPNNKWTAQRMIPYKPNGTCKMLLGADE